MRCNDSGTFKLRYPGRLVRGARAVYHVRVRVDDVGTQGSGVPRPRAGSFKTRDAHAQPVADDPGPRRPRIHRRQSLTLADLARYRDARGVTQGEWSFSVVGQKHAAVRQRGRQPGHAG